jgi:hypothetical protein
MTHRHLLPIVLLAACASEPQLPPTEYAASPTADTLVATVVGISDAIRRSDGSYVLLAPEEGALLVADFAAKAVSAHPGITREEVPGPSVLLAAGDTAIVGDWGLRRMTSWLADGARVDAVPIPEGSRGALPRARDAAGQWYFAIGPNPGRDGSGNTDSTALVRADAMLTRFDTIARLSPPDLGPMQADGQARMQVRALSGRDAWGVLRDGTLWIARVNQNQLEWHPVRGERYRTRPLADPILTVTEMDRQIWLRRFPEEQRNIARTTPFALVKPPFERAFAEPDGRIWLFKSAPALDSVRTFQVADSSGVKFLVKVPSRGEALAVGHGVILMGEQFPEGVRLLRYAIPPEARRSVE